MAQTRSNAGFSLLEMIGVMAVMAILAGALAPSIFQMIEEGYQGAEAQSMDTISGALEAYITYNKTIPSQKQDKWTAAVADYAGLSPNRVRLNDKNFERKLFMDPKFFAGGGGGGDPFFMQGQGLSAMPSSPRILLISSLDGEVKVKLTNKSQFDKVWDQDKGAKVLESKTVFIERINLAPAFKRVVLSNANASQSGFVLEAGSEGAVAGASGGSDGVRTLYVLVGSKLSLRAAPFPGGATQRQLIVDRDMSLRYETDGVTWYWAG